MHILSLKLRLLALTALVCQTASAGPIIASVVETGGDNDPTDTIPAKWTGTNFTVSIANEPVPGAVVGSTFVVGTFGEGAPAFVDRNHRYTAATNIVSIPAYLVGHEYIMSGNDNRDNVGYILDVTVDRAVDVYMLIDNRLGDPNSPNTDPPSFGATRMQWILDQGWVPSTTGANRNRDISLPDEVGIDEGADGTINQWYSVYTKSFPAGTFQLRQADNTGQNMYGVVVTPAATGRIVTVNTVNNEAPGVGETSLLQALTDLQEGDRIHFNIPGPGPHTIVTPMGGYPPIAADDVTLDGYSQPGSQPNTRGILQGNNAILKIVLDSSSTNVGVNPEPGGLALHHSTRLLYPGFGDTEDAILPVVGARNFTARGLSFVSRYARDESDDPNVYCVAFVNVTPGGTDQPATGGHVNGCWFGLRPDGTSLRGGRASVATFRNNTQQTATGLTIGTDGDGVADRTEFNIHAAMSLAFHLQVSDVRVSGNYVNVLPSGTNFVDVDAVAREIGSVQDPANPDPSPASVEFLENANCVNVLIGTDGNGVSDAEERNIVANVSYSETMEFWREAANVVVAGNYFGVGVDGVTASPVSVYDQPDFVRLSRIPSSIRIGSNGDGISDSIEGNLLVNLLGDRFVAPGNGGAGPDIAEITVRRNSLLNCAFPAVPFANSATPFSGYYADVVADINMPVVPVLAKITNAVLVGSFAAPNVANYPFVFVDVYLADPAALANTNGVWPSVRVLPGRWLAAFADNGPGDADPAPNQFLFDISSFNLPNDTYVSVAVTYSKVANNTTSDNSVTSPMSNPVNPRPIVHFEQPNPNQISFWWLSGPGAFLLQANSSVVEPNNWLEIPTESYFDGRSIVTQDLFFDIPAQFYRLISQ